MGLSGVQRTLKLVKYLHDSGWPSTVLTVTAKTYMAFDDSLLKEIAGRDIDVIRTHPIDPAKAFKKRKTIKLKSEWIRKLLNRLSQLIFIPDNKRYWIKEAIRKGMEELSSKPYDLLFSTAPPYTDHLVGLELKKRTGLPLVVDFRDSWLDNPYHFYWTPFHKTLHYHMERGVVKGANLILTINRVIKEKIVARHRDILNLSQVKILSQGYDQEDFDRYGVPYRPGNYDKMRWIYTGIFYERNTPEPLYKALALLKTTHPTVFQQIEFHMIGYVQKEFINRTKALDITDAFIYHDYQEHPMAIQWLCLADALWLSLGIGKGYESISTGKVYEYIGSGKPVMALTPDNEVSRLLKGMKNSTVIDPGMTSQIRDTIVNWHQLWTTNSLPQLPMEFRKPYDRKNLAFQLSRELNQLLRLD